jgi:hypothetical protein
VTEPHHDPAKEALDHLQRAALEMIAATRAFLDLAESVVGDSDALATVGHLIGDLAAKGRAAAAESTRSSRAHSDDPPHPGVQHIRVS